MKTKEDKFTDELEVFRKEVESAIQFFYVSQAFHSALKESRTALDLINRTPLFWRTNLGALRISFFITLGRIFDQHSKSKHNVDRLLKIVQENKEIFSMEALEARKRAGSDNADEWIHSYMKTVYVPDFKDFRRLRGYVNKYRKIYESRYREIRHKVHAHKQLSKPEDVQALYAKTSIIEIEKILIFLNRLYHAFWQLFHNGRKPVLKPMKYSADRMRKAEIPKWRGGHIQERIVRETEKFIKMLLSMPR